MVGVGEGDFGAMEALDADAGPLAAPSGAAAERDIVQVSHSITPRHWDAHSSHLHWLQFVRLDAFLGSRGWPESQRALAKEVLREIPPQVAAYFNARGLRP